MAVGEAASLDGILRQLSNSYMDLKLVSSPEFKWSPEDKTIYYNPDSSTAIWSVLHEAGHMLSNHADFKSDIGLLKMEVAAWQKARDLAAKFNVEIDENHVEKCLDSYRDWMYRRSSCPLCTQAGIERETGLYTCINCQKKWRVTPARFCRVYRKTV